MNISGTLTDLELPTEEYIVVGSGILNALNLRESNDIDLVVSEALFEHLSESGNWKRQTHNDLDIPIVERGPVEAFLTWDDPQYQPNLASLQQDQRVMDDVPYVSLARLRRWKERTGRPKDISDIALIDEYVRKHSH